MEKLIELIIEFQKKTGQTAYDLDMYHYDDKLKLIIIGSDLSKGFIDYIDIFRLLFAPGFIKWLVDNNKIDLVKVGKKSDMGFGDRYSREDTVLMLLSISDTPIEDLICYLK